MNGWPQPDPRPPAHLADVQGHDAHVLTLLQGLLPSAVALMLDQVRHESWPERLARIERLRSGNILVIRRTSIHFDAFTDEALITRTPETAKRFVQLVEFIAVGAFVPGGIRAFGLHWEEKDGV